MKKRGYNLSVPKKDPSILLNPPIGSHPASTGETLRLLKEYNSTKLKLYDLERTLIRAKRRSIEPKLHTGRWAGVRRRTNYGQKE